MQENTLPMSPSPREPLSRDKLALLSNTVSDVSALTPHFIALCQDLLDYSKSLEAEVEDLKCILSTTLQHSTTVENDLSLQQENSAALWKRYEFIVNASQEWVCVIREDLTFEMVNDAFAKACRKSKKKLVGQHIREVWPKQDELTLLSSWIRTCLSNQDVHVQMPLHMGSKSHSYLDIVGMPYQLPGLPTGQMVLILRDISARHNIETLLRERSLFLDQVHDAVVVMDQDGRIYFWNKRAETMYGWKAHHVIEKKRASIFMGPMECKRLSAIFGIVDKQGLWEGRMHHLYKQKEDVWTISSWTKLHSQKDSQFYLLTAVNISPMRKLENEYNRLQRFYTATQIFIESSHDLNNAMVTYMSTTRMIREHIPKTVMGGLFSLSDDAIRKSMNIVKHMLEFGRGNALDHTFLEITPIIYELTKMLGLSLPNHITLHTQLPDAPCYVVGNSTELHQVLLNLCLNAKDAIGDKEGQIVVAVSSHKIRKGRIARPHLETIPPGKYVILTVSDTGHGIQKRQLSHIFTPFFSTKRLGEGTGVGLASVYRIIKNHEGWIHATSKLNHGTRFTIFLPCAPKQKELPNVL